MTPRLPEKDAKCDWCENKAVEFFDGDYLCEVCAKKDLLTRMIEIK